MSTSVSIHHIQDLTFKQENLFMPDGSLIRLMYVTAVDKKGDVNEITLYLTENCQIEELIK
jgi:hypothetical protein